jgi:hypothetical protein
MTDDKNMLDVRYCLMKQSEYLAKARATRNDKLKSAYEAVAHEFAARIRYLITHRFDDERLGIVGKSTPTVDD